MQWYYGIGNEVNGPVENEDLVRLVKSGEVRPETPVWASYLGNWTQAGKIDGLFNAAGVTLPPPVAPAPSGELVAAGQATVSSHAGSAGSLPQGTAAPTAPGSVAGLEEKTEEPVGDVAPVPKIETSKLGLSTVASQSAAVVQNTAGVQNPAVVQNTAGVQNPGVVQNSAGVENPPVVQNSAAVQNQGATLNTAGVQNPAALPLTPRGSGPEKVADDTSDRPGGEGAPALNPPAPAGDSALNPNGIPVPGSDASKPETSTPDDAPSAESDLLAPAGATTPVNPTGEGLSIQKPAEGSELSDGLSDFAPKREKGSAGSKGTDWKKWGMIGAAALVLLSGVAALADKFVLGGKLFGLGARPTGPYRYFPDAPRFAFNVEVRGLLLNPVVAGKIEEGGGMNMIDQMMHSAVGLRPYDIEDVKVVGTDLSMTSPRFVCAITTTKKIPEELLVEKFFGDEKPNKIRGTKVYDLPMMVGGSAVACIPDETTFLIGGRDEIEAVLLRTEEPAYSEAETEMVESAIGSKAILSVSFDGEMLGKLAELQENLPGPTTAMQGDFYHKEFMKSARAISMSMDVTDRFVVDYRINFESEAASELALAGIKEEFEKMDESDFVAQMVAGGTDPSMADPKMFREIMEAMKYSRDGSTVVMEMGLPVDFFESLVGQGMGGTRSF